MALREILVELGFDVDKSDQKKADAAVAGLEKKVGLLKKAFVGVGALFAGGALVRGLSDFVRIAGDDAETLDKFRRVFVGATDDMLAAVARISEDTGVADTILRGLAAEAGSLIRPFTETTSAAAELSKQMVGVTLDLAAFENQNPQDVLNALRSSLVGATIPMLRYGIDTRAAAVEQFALAQGVNKSVAEMTQQEKLTFRLGTIMEQMGPKGALGNATETAGAFAGRLRAVSGQVLQLKGDLGAVLLPAATTFLNTLYELTRALNPGFVRAARTVTRIVQGLLAPFQRLSTTLAFLGGTLLVALGVSFQAFGVTATIAAMKVGASWVLALLPFVALLALIALIVDDLAAMGDGSESVTGTMIKGFSDLVDETGGVGSALAEMWKTAVSSWDEAFRDMLGISDEKMIEIVGSIDRAWSGLIEGIKSMWGRMVGGFRSTVDFFTDLFGGTVAPAETTRRGDAAVAARNVAAFRAERTRRLQSVSGLSSTGNRSLVSSPSTTTTVNVDATGSGGNPEAIGGAVRRAVEQANDAVIRQTRDAFVASAG